MSTSQITSRFGASVRSLRHSQSLSQEALAERADLHRTYIAGIEGGVRNVTLKTIEKLAHALQVSTATLLLDVGGDARQLELASGKASNGKHKPMEILLVADNEEAENLTLQAFQQARIVNPVQGVRDGQAALDFLFHTGSFRERKPGDQPRLVLLDVNLPKVSGLEVLRRLKADKRTRTIPIVALTNSKSVNVTAECLESGANACIVKPVTLNGIAAAVQKLGMSWLLLEPPSNR